MGRIQERKLCTAVLGIVEPWLISEVELNKSTEEVEIHIEARIKGRMACPDRGQESEIHDRRERRWRHLDTCEYRALIVALVPRIHCPEHGVHQVTVPWGEWNSRFTKAFEAFAIGRLEEATVSAVARRLRLSCWSLWRGCFDSTRGGHAGECAGLDTVFGTLLLFLRGQMQDAAICS